MAMDTSLNQPRGAYTRRPQEQVDVNIIETQIDAGTRRISWGAILAGLVIALVVMVSLNMLGFSIGVNSIDPAEETYPFAEGLGTASVVWIAGSTLLALFAGGWVAGYMARVYDDVSGAIHGLVVFGLYTLLALWFMTTAISTIVSGLSGLVGQGLNLVGQGAVDVAPAVVDAISLQDSTLASIRGEVDQFFTTESGVTIPETDPATGEVTTTTVPEDEFTSLEQLQLNTQITRFLMNPEDVNREELVVLISENTTLTEEEAATRLDRWEAAYTDTVNDLQETAEQVGQDVADTLAAIGGVLFAMMIAGAFAGGAGGVVAVEQRKHSDDVVVLDNAA